MKPPAICIVGKDKRKKLALMEALITELKTRGLKVGALKYHKHGDFDIDIEGKDTWKYAKAGADTVAIASSVKFAVIKKVRAEPEIDDIIEKDFEDCDIVLADGFTLSDKSRIIVTDSEEDIEVFKRGCEVVAVIGRNNGREDVQVLADTVVRFCGLKKPQTDYVQNML